MNKWQIICPIAAIATVVVVFAVISGRNHHRYFVYAQSRMVGEELATTTNSPHLVQVGLALRKQLSEFLVLPAGLSEVLVGDEPPPIGDGSACSRVILSNAVGGRLGIRLRQDAQQERFQVLDFWALPMPGTQSTATRRSTQ